MRTRRVQPTTETQRKRSYVQRMMVVHGALLVCVLVILARLIDLQILRSSDFAAQAQGQHYGSIRLPAKRGEILTVNSKTNELSILATNTTLDLLYVDPLIVQDAAALADTLATTLLTPQTHQLCLADDPECPRELESIYASPDPFADLDAADVLLEPLPSPADAVTRRLDLSLTDARRSFAAGIERRISEQWVTFSPLQYGADKLQMREVEALGLSGITVDQEQRLIYANPQEVDQSRLDALGQRLGEALRQDPIVLRRLLTSRPLRYVAIMRRLSPQLSLRVKELKLQSMRETSQRRQQALQQKLDTKSIQDPLRAVTLLPEHWRFYPDPTLASQVVGFLNNTQEAQYGAERSYDPELRGQEGEISTVSDPQGGQIVTGEQTIRAAQDGDAIILTIDPFVQQFVEERLARAIQEVEAEHAQVIVMEAKTGRITAMANAPLFNRSSYADVFAKEAISLTPEETTKIAVEVYEPTTNARVVQAYLDDVFTPEGRTKLTEATQQVLRDLEVTHDLADLTRYYIYKGETVRMEVFPTNHPLIWQKFRNSIGVGAYLNRTIQEIYEPGSVMKPITMAIALDQGEVTPGTTYVDSGAVIRNDFPIDNNDFHHYGLVNMTNCLEYSINTCMVHVSERLGRKLFAGSLERFGFGQVTGVGLEDEVSGDISPWRTWSDAQLATTSFGQGIATTPLQMITAYTPLANAGKLLRPNIIHGIRHPDGTIDLTEPKVIDQVLTPETAETVTAMLVSSADVGFAKVGRPKGYAIAGKTGTSQIAGPGGRYETGTGSTIASYVGYGPVDDPAFIVLVKIDRAKQKRSVHGATAAAPVFKDIAAFLFQYYGIPPDRQN
jgi:cell division protein FtsI/penicillin-binding protein 2